MKPEMLFRRSQGWFTCRPTSRPACPVGLRLQ